VKKQVIYVKFFIYILAAIITLPGIILAENNKSNDKVVLKIWRIPRKDVRSAYMRAERQVYERFLELNPDLELKAAAGIAMAGMDSADSVSMALAGGTAPDVMLSYLRKSTTYIDQGLYLPLDGYFSNEEISKFHPKIMPAIMQKGPPDGKEHLYLIPIGAPLIMAMQYRKDVFAKAGLDPKKPPKNWEEFIEYSKKMYDPDKGIYGYAGPTGVEAGWHFFNFIYQAGGDIVAKNEKGEWQAVYNSKETIMALKFYQRLFHEEFIKNGKKYKGVVFRGSSTEITRAMSEGRIGMSFNYIDEQKLFPPGANTELYEIAPLPVGPTGKGGGEFNQDMLGVNSQVKDPRVFDAAVRYLKYMSSEEPKRISTGILVEEGLGRFLNPKYLKSFGYSDLLEDANPQWIKVNEEAFKYAHPEPYGKNCDMIYSELSVVLDKIQSNPNVDIAAELAIAEKHTNEQLLGKLEEKERKNRTAKVWIVLFVIAVVFSYFGIRAFRIFKEMSKPNAVNYQKTSFRNHMFAWLFMGIAVITVLMWSYFPVGSGLLMAFQNYKIVGNSEWIGLGNFIQLFWQPIFWQSVVNTVFYVVLTLALGFFAPIILALIFNEIPRGSLFFRMIFYLPTVTSGIIVLLLWKQFYEPSQAGLFNKLLAAVNLPGQMWLFDSKLAMLCIIIPGIWGGVGAGSVFYLAALKNVPEELYESSSIDGAGIWGKLRHVTYPTLSMLLIINFVGAFIGAFNATSNILVMTGGGPANATHVIGLEIFYNAYVYLRFGYATAIAWVLGSFLVGFTVLQLRILRDVRFTTVNKL